MRYRNAAAGIIDHDRLDIFQVAAAGSRVANVTDGVAARQLVENRIPFKAIRYQTHTTVGMQVLTVAGDDTAAFLAAMLQRVKPEVGQVGGLRMAEDAEDSAFILKLVEHKVSFLHDKDLPLSCFPRSASLVPRPGGLK